jgi:hypothetical protein
MKHMQSTSRDPLLDRSSANPDRQQLSASDDAMLSLRQLGHCRV